MEPGLGALADGYRLDGGSRQALADLLVRRIMSMADLLDDGHRTGTQPWARLWQEGRARTWHADADYTRQQLDALRRARGLRLSPQDPCCAPRTRGPRPVQSP